MCPSEMVDFADVLLESQLGGGGGDRMEMPIEIKKWSRRPKSARRRFWKFVAHCRERRLCSATSCWPRSVRVQCRQARGTLVDCAAMSLMASRVDLLQAFEQPSRLVAGEEGLGNGFEVLADRGCQFHHTGPTYCESNLRRRRPCEPAWPARLYPFVAAPAGRYFSSRAGVAEWQTLRT